MNGLGIVRASAVGTLVFVVTAVAAAVVPDTLGALAVAVALVLFAAGCGVFLWAYAIAVGRSREVEIGIGGLFFLAGTAPRDVQIRLLGMLGAQVVVALATAGARPFTSLAFGILAPMYGLALCGLWGARYGTFGPRAGSGPASA